MAGAEYHSKNQRPPAFSRKVSRTRGTAIIRPPGQCAKKEEAKRERPRAGCETNAEWLEVTMSVSTIAVIATDLNGVVTFMESAAELDGFGPGPVLLECAQRRVSDCDKQVGRGSFQPLTISS